MSDSAKREAALPSLAGESRRLMGIGLAIGLLLGSYGYILIVGILDSLFCPPLVSQENFGQFGMLAFLVVPVMLLPGCTFGLIPHLSRPAWVVCFSAALLVSCSMALSTGALPSSHPLHVTVVALWLTGIVLGLIGLAFCFRFQSELTRERRAAASAEPR